MSYIGIVLALMLMASAFLSFGQAEPSPYKYYEIIGLFEDNKISEYEIDLASSELTFKLRGEDKVHLYRLPYTLLFLEQVQDKVDAYNRENPNSKIAYDLDEGQEYSWLLNLMPTLLIVVMMGLFWYFTMRQGKGGNVTSFGKAKTRNPDEGRKVVFADVAGAEEEKAELVEIVEFLKNPSKFNLLGARIPKGVLLVGPPGTGKTLLARAVAGEAGAPFFSISGSDFVEMFVGVGASRVRDLFDQAKKNSPSIIFIDEIDAVGRQRGAGVGGGHDEREQTLNQLLVEMDGFASNSGVIIIAATNRRDILDPALLRPGRFDRQIIVGYPDVQGREEILRVHTRNKPIAPDVDLLSIAKTTAGFTGADLENIMNEAALLAARADRKAITNIDVQEATVKVIAGPEKRSKVITENDKKLTAYHEAGHALCTYYLEDTDKVHQVSIIPRGMAGGYTLSLPKEDRGYRTRGEMFASVIALLGGRVAEELVLDDISTGASNDIERATAMARAMITKYGFSSKLGPIVYGHDQSEVFLGRDISQGRNYSEGVASEIDNEIRSLIERAYRDAGDILKTHMDKLELIAKRLIEFEKIESVEFEQLMTLGYIPEKEEPKDDEADLEEMQGTESVEQVTETPSVELEETEEIKDSTIDEPSFQEEKTEE